MPKVSKIITVEDFNSVLAAADIHRGYVFRRGAELVASHQELSPLTELLRQSSSYADHEAVFVGREDGIPTPFFAFVHDTRRGLAQGGLRFKAYDTLESLVFDGLRLSQGMTRKNALAGLWWGGGKAIVPITQGLDRPEYRDRHGSARRPLFQAFGRLIASLNGIYYTAEDVGTYTDDMDAILSVNRFVTCISSEYGGSGNPSPHTAQGVFAAMKVALKFLDREPSFEDRVVAVQGAGNVGWPLIEALHAEGAVLRVADVSPDALERVRALGERHRVVEDPDSIYDEEAEIFAPCANGDSVNHETIPRLLRSGVRLICGAANNILGCDEDAETLAANNMLFVPDFVCNRLGIVNCANEPFGYLQEDIDRAIAEVGPDTLAILKEASRSGRTPLAEANERADLMATELHPLWRKDKDKIHRGRKLIEQLASSKWASKRVESKLENSR